MKKIVILASIIVIGFLIYLPESSKLNTPSAILYGTTSLPISSTSQSTLSPLPLYTIGHITRHPGGYVNKVVKLAGYMLTFDKTYVIFSDESGGSVNSYDLPVIGPGIEALKFKQKYILQGTFVYGGLNANNHNEYHLELSNPPQPIQ